VYTLEWGSSTNPHGIKVMLVSGKLGRVQAIVS
jgi:uncharacterized repeat protein (TIGR03833 family)